MNSIYSYEYREQPHLPHVFAYYNRADMEATTPRNRMHLHSLSEIMYLAQGEAEVAIHPDISVKLSRRQYIWLDAFVPHRLIIKPGHLCSMINIEFDLLPQKDAPGVSLGELCEKSAELSEMLNHPVPFLALHDEGNAVHNLLKQIIRQESGGLAGHQSRSSMLTSGLLLVIAGSYKEQGANTDRPGKQHVDRALQYIQSNYTQPLGVSNLADILHLHPSYLHKLFREHTGKSVCQNIRDIRMQAACALLKETENSLSSICLAVGLSSSAQLSKQFQEVYGQSPLEYRKTLS